MNTSEVEGIRKKAYVYTRVSTKEQAIGASLDVQENDCIEFAENVLGADVVRIYKDEGESAKTANRPQLIQMLRDASREKGLIDYAVFYCPDRASRSTEAFQAVIKHNLKKCGIEIRYATQPGIDGSRMGNFVETIMVGVAELENGIKADRVHASMAERAKQGYWITQPPLGFKIKILMPDGSLVDSAGRKERVKYPKVLVPDDTILPGQTKSISDSIAEIFNLYASGSVELYQAHKMAVNAGLKGKNGQPLPYNSFEHMLEHPVYCGYSKPGKALSESIKLKFDGIISRATYDLIQTRLKANKRGTKVRDNNLYPLDGTILCPHKDCNNCLRGDDPGNGSKKRIPRYYCRGGHKRGHKYESAKASEIHTLFNDFLQQLTPTNGAIRLFKEVLKRTAAKKLSNANNELEAVSKAEKKLSDKKKAVLDLLLEGKVTVEEKDFMLADVENEREALKSKRKELEEQQELNELTIEYVCNFMSQPAKLWRDADLESKKALQKLLFPKGLHIDLKAKKCRTEDLSPLYSVVCNKNEPNGSNSDSMVTLVESKWNDLVSDIYRIKSIIPVIVYQNTSSTSVV